MDHLKKEEAELSAHAEKPDFWGNQDRAKDILKRREVVQETISSVDAIKLEFDQIKELYGMAKAEGNDAMIAEDIEPLLNTLHKDVEKLRIKALLSDPIDAKNAFLEIHAGAGGTEAQDWAEMLLRMYMRWAEKRGFQVEYLAELSGDEAGIKSATIKINGHQAYGWLKTESGVHRLVRISPFDSNKRRHTSFASIWVYPEIDDDIVIDISEKDLRIDTYRASGAGGQHVNKTDSAVRITHIPTNIVVQCQSDRSQHRNKASAMAMLKSRLFEFEERKKKEKAQVSEASKKDIGWGSQIRSYVLQPYQLVKDMRTGVEKTNPTAVLDGDIDDFIEAALSL